MRGQHPRDFVLQLKPLQYFKLQMGERMHSHKALSSLFSLHCGPIILTCNHKSHSDNWLFFFFLVMGHKRQNKDETNNKDRCFLSSNGWKTLNSFLSNFPGWYFFPLLQFAVLQCGVLQIFSLFSISLFEDHTTEQQSVTDGWALVFAVNVLSTEKLSVCSGSSNSKCRQASGSHMHLAAQHKSFGPGGSSRWKFSGLTFATQDGCRSCVTRTFHWGFTETAADWN